MSSGFNLLSLKKEDNQTQKKLYKRHLVIGEDVFSVALYNVLLSKFGENEVGWVCSHELTANDVALLGPSTLRGNTNLEKLKSYFPDRELALNELPSLFYKDMKWKDFGGRAKSEKLLWSEEYFTAARCDIELSDYLECLKDDDFLERVNSKRMDFKVKSMSHITPDDLAEPSNFEVVVASGELIRCENLYWGMGPSEYLNLYLNKNELSNEFIEFCESTQTPTALYMRYDFEKPITDMKETLFIPLSYTHEWGHFVGEFSEYEVTIERNTAEASENEEDEEDDFEPRSLIKKIQRAEFVTFMDIGHTSEDDISKKIRLFKKNLEKIFGENAGDFLSEFIKLDSLSGCLNIDDKLGERALENNRKLKFYGYNAPLEHFSSDAKSCEDSIEHTSFLARALSRHQEIIHSL